VVREVFRGKIVEALKQAFRNGQLNFQGDLKLLAQTKIFAAWLRPLYRQDWIVYLKRPSVAPHMCCNIWAATPIAWPSPTIAWFPSPMAKSLFAGAIPLTTTNRSCCLYRSTSS
jgi:hypothetical protein